MKTNGRHLKVLYIAGDGRSGSTLLERLLGQHDDIFCAGELINIWQRSFAEDQLCSCGAPFSRCHVWRDIAARFRAELGDFDLPGILAAHRNIDRIRHVPRLYALRKSPRDNPHLAMIHRYAGALYRSIRDITGCRWIVDASKAPQLAYILSMHPEVELYLLQLVRDARGVVYSWNKRVVRPEITGEVVFMPVYGPGRSAGHWSVINLLCEFAGNHAAHYRRVRYEDLVEQPLALLNGLFSALDLQPRAAEICLPGNRIRLSTTHTVSGNPMRFKTGEIELSKDEAWRTQMKRMDRWISSVVTRPLLRRYGYRRSSDPCR